MKNRRGVREAGVASLFFACAALCMAGCAGTGAADPPSHPVNVEGQTYLISQLTAGTWTAVAPAPASGNAISSPSARSALLRAIELRSGCKVTDADYSRNGKQLDAQVDCAGRLTN
jgi:hypothetical protein